jgi:hypothetical protein
LILVSYLHLYSKVAIFWKSGNMWYLSATRCCLVREYADFSWLWPLGLSGGILLTSSFLASFLQITKEEAAF